MITSTQSSAKLILDNIRIYGEEKDKEHNRFKMSESNLMQISGHAVYLPEPYVQELATDLLQLDWLMFKSAPAEYSFMAISVTKNWTKLSAKRVLEI